MNDLFTKENVFSAYKKLKHYFYYDNTSLLIKQRIADFEGTRLPQNELSDIRDSLFLIMKPLLDLKEGSQDSFFSGNDALGVKHIDYHLIPKAFKKSNLGFITNIRDDEDLRLTRLNIFINASIEVHIISVLWLMYAGKYLKQQVTNVNYAYELQISDLNDEEQIVDGLRLFKPYFMQYQQWRDNAISKAEELIKDKKNVTILSLDIKDYFHSVDVNVDLIKDELVNLLTNKLKKSLSDMDKRRYTLDLERIKILSSLLGSIHLVYADKISDLLSFRKRVSNYGTPLPIGLMSSGLLGNYYLKTFDEAIVDKLNPAFYGRYVDDLMFVFPNVKVEIQSISTVNTFLSRYFVDRKLLAFAEETPSVADPLFVLDADDCGNSITRYHREEEKDEIFLRVPKNIHYQEDYLSVLASQVKFKIFDYPNLIIQSDKVVLHHINHRESQAALNKFKKKLEDQRSEFRFLPDEDKLSSEFDDEAFSLQYNDSINKFRSIQELSEDKYGASKFLAQKIFARNYGDNEKDEETDNQILTFFKGFVGITFYSLWEKVATYFIITNRPDNLIKFKRNILKSINAIGIEKSIKIYNENHERQIKDHLTSFLMTSIAIPLALNPKAKFEYLNQDEIEFFDKCRSRAKAIRNSNMFRQALTHVPAINYTNYSIKFGGSTNLLEFNSEILEKFKNLTDESNSETVSKVEPGKISENKVEKATLLEINSRLAALSPRYVYFHELNIKKIFEVVVSIDDKELNLFHYRQGSIDSPTDSLNSVRDESNINANQGTSDVNSNFQGFDKINNIPNSAFDDYWKINYKWRSNKGDSQEKLRDKYFKINSNSKCDGPVEYFVDIKGEDPNKGINKKVAIANTKVNELNIIASIRSNPNLSRERRKELFGIFNQADKEKSELIVLPEVSVPYSWIKLLAYRSHKRNIAIVAGLEHWVNSHGFAFNFMVTILPIRIHDYTTSIIKIRLKNHYAHDEKEILKGHRLLIPRDTIANYPKSYDLFHWRNVYFSVYNCFELADIGDRGLFKSKVDFIVAAEYNRDTAYFSDIAGSWVRDVHSYFIQVNTSHYGDSRLIQPAKSFLKDLIQIKGGINTTILVSVMEIEKIREFQLVEFNLQKDMINLGKTVFKPTPPDFDRKNVQIRIDNGSFIYKKN